MIEFNPGDLIRLKEIHFDVELWESIEYDGKLNYVLVDDVKELFHIISIIDTNDSNPPEFWYQLMSVTGKFGFTVDINQFEKLISND